MFDLPHLLNLLHSASVASQKIKMMENKTVNSLACTCSQYPT